MRVYDWIGAEIDIIIGGIGDGFQMRSKFGY
jgi:hypothetical protein